MDDDPGLPTHVSALALGDDPFSVAPTPRFVYESAVFRKTFGQLLEALRRREPLTMMTGEAGTGKTMICRCLLERVEPRALVSVIFDPFVTFEALLLQVLVDFGVVDSDAVDAIASSISGDALVSVLHRFLRTLIHLDARAVIVIDEAQRLPPEVLERVRLLSNVETNTAKLLQIVLVGQPSLADLVDSRPMSQVRQRISCRCSLEPLTRREVARYIERRLSLVQGDAAAESTGDHGESPAGRRESRRAPTVVFSTRAVARIARISGGVPRLINVLCDRALRDLANRGGRTVLAGDVVDAGERLHVLRNVRGARRLVASAAAVLIGVALFTGSRGSTPRAASKPGIGDVTLATASGGDTKVIEAPLRLSPAFLVSVAAFRTVQRADAAAARLNAAGIPAFTRAGSGGWQTVMAGPYVSRLEALDTVRRLPSEFPAPRVVTEN